MLLVDLEHVCRSYGSLRALDDVNLRLEPGPIGLIGNNGAGKSTLLKVLLGLLRPDSGRGTILGHPLGQNMTALRGRVGYVPEAAAMVPVLKGVEFVALSGDLAGMPHRDARRRAHEVLNYVGLGELRYRRLEEYSTGNLQRLKLAAALVHDPQLLLLDEPTNGLDPHGREKMLQLLADLIAETGKSVILCTHLLGDVERFCRQVVMLHRGRVVRYGSLSELRQTSVDRFDLEWQGDGAEFLEALRQAGASVVPHTRPDRATIVAAAWPTARFFELAVAHGIVVRHLKPDEENLERMFLRVTRNEPDRA